MSRVVVTGGSGKLGRAVVADLLAHGHAVINLDRHSPQQREATFIETDLTDYGQVVGAITGIDDVHDGVDAVVHLAAIPAPGLRPNSLTFSNNMTATYNVFTAARVAGVKKIVWASSETVLGLPFDTAPPYLPVNEDYAARPESTYSLVKHLEEEMAAQLCRWDPTLSMIGLRFSNVMEPQDYAKFPDFDADARARKWNLWGYIDARDGAQTVRLALAHGSSGREVFIIANADTVMTRSNAELAAEVFPGVALSPHAVGNETLLSIEKARRVLGFEPQHSWRAHQ